MNTPLVRINLDVPAELEALPDRAGVAMSGESAGERYQALVHKLGDEIGKRRGWKAAVAARLGVHPSYISKIVSGGMTSVGADVIARAARSLPIQESYFYGGREPLDPRGLPPRRGPDELDVMRELEALPDDARARVLAWAAARWP